MTTLSAADILQAALKLPAPERLRISKELYDSVPPPGVMAVDDPGIAEELNRRSAAYRSGEMASSTWDEVETRLNKRLEEERASRES